METRLSAVDGVRKTPPPKSAESGGGPKPPTAVTRPSSVLTHLGSEVTLDKPVVLLFGKIQNLQSINFHGNNILRDMP